MAMTVAAWEKRRAKGGPYNAPAVGADGTVRPDTYREVPETGCRIWLGATNGNETPTATINGKRVAVRRAIWQRVYGDPVPKDVGTTCRHPRCVAIDHMKNGRTDNSIDADMVEGVRALAGRLSFTQIGRRIGVSHQTARKYAGVTGHFAYHRGAKAFAGRDIPNRPAGLTDRQWSIFLASHEKKLCEVGADFGITRQRVDQIVKQVMAALSTEGITA